MPTMTLEQVEKVVAGWRSGLGVVEGWESPAGPLFASGDYAEADITMNTGLIFQTCGTNCSYSCIGNSQQYVFCC